LSHIKAIERAKERKLDWVLICEDDIEFENKFFEKLQKVWIEDFDMLFLNGTDGLHIPPTSFNEHWLRWHEGYGAFAYIVNSRFYDIILTWLQHKRTTDTVFSMFMQFYKVYKLKVPLVFHKPGKSDIQGIVPKNYKHLERGYKV